MTIAGKPGTQASYDGPALRADGSSTSAVSFYDPPGITVDSSGNLYVCDVMRDIILKINPKGMVTAWCGLSRENSHVEGTGKNARFSGPDHSRKRIFLTPGLLGTKGR